MSYCLILCWERISFHRQCSSVSCTLSCFQQLRTQALRIIRSKREGLQSSWVVAKHAKVFSHCTALCQWSGDGAEHWERRKENRTFRITVVRSLFSRSIRSHWFTWWPTFACLLCLQFSPRVSLLHLWRKSTSDIEALGFWLNLSTARYSFCNAPLVRNLLQKVWQNNSKC